MIMRNNFLAIGWSTAFVFTVFAAILNVPLAQAQNAGPAGNLDVSAPRVVAQQKPGNQGQTVRLEGNASTPARVRSPQVNLSARLIELEITPGRSVKEIRAREDVNFDLNLKGARGNSVKVQATCSTATLQPNAADRRLLLKGGVKGWYQEGATPEGRINLSGEEVSLRLPPASLLVEVQGGKSGVRLELPPSLLGGLLGEGPAAAKAVTAFTADRMALDETTGLATFTGNARLASAGGPNRFDLRAPVLLLERDATGALKSFRSRGRATVLLDIPLEGAATAPPGEAGEGKTVLSRPTYLSAEGDALVVQRQAPAATRNDLLELLLQGNVVGQYRLGGEAGAAQNFNYRADQVTARQVVGEDKQPTWRVELTGRPVHIEVPGLNLDLGS